MHYSLIHRIAPACFGLSCYLSATAWAESGQWHAAAGLAIKHFRFDEFDRQESRLVREQGPLPGLMLSGGYAASRWDLELAGAIYGGEIDYDGQTQGGQALSTDTDETFYELDFQARYRILSLARVPASLYLLAGADTRLWERRIQGTATVSGLDEDYRWHRLSAGGAWEYHLPAGGTVAVQARFTRTLDPRVEVHFENGFDDARLDLQQRYGWRLDAGWSGEVAAGTELRIAGFVEYYEFGSSANKALTSNGVAVGTLFQPRSETREAGLSARFLYRW